MSRREKFREWWWLDQMYEGVPVPSTLHWVELCSFIVFETCDPDSYSFQEPCYNFQVWGIDIALDDCLSCARDSVRRFSFGRLFARRSWIVRLKNKSQFRKCLPICQRRLKSALLKPNLSNATQKRGGDNSQQVCQAPNPRFKIVVNVVARWPNVTSLIKCDKII